MTFLYIYIYIYIYIYKYIYIYIYVCVCLCDIFDIDMNRNTWNRGGQQGYQNQRSTRHTRNNPLYDDLFNTSAPSIAPSEASSDPMRALAITVRGEPIDAPLPTEIVR